MKLKKLKQILELYLLNSRPYEHTVKNTSSDFLTSFNLIQIISHLKKALHIIFEYHRAHKKILFVGLPKKLEVKINKLTHHIAVDSNFDLRRVISNSYTAVNSIKVENKLFSKVLTKSLIPKLSRLFRLSCLVLKSKEIWLNFLVQLTPASPSCAKPTPPSKPSPRRCSSRGSSISIPCMPSSKASRRRGWTTPRRRCFRMSSRSRRWGWCRRGGT